ncbi:MAG: fibronectin type III domain-containing protein [Flavobacteriales bacterium]
MSWGGVRGRGSYQLLYTTTPDIDSSYVLLATTTRNRFVAEGLAGNTTYYFRVVAVGAAGSSPMSDPAQAKVA